MQTYCKKICFFIGGMARGGAERVISILANHYVEQGHIVYIVMLLTDRVEYELNSQIKVINLSRKDKTYCHNAFFWLKHIRSFVNRVRPDITVAFAARIAILVQLACIGLKQNIIVSERNDPAKDGRSIWVKLLTNILYPMCNCVIFQTERAKSRFSYKIQSKSRVIPNPIKVYCYAANENPKKIVAVGRLAEQKNHKLLIDAFFDISFNTDYELWIYGEGNLRKELEAYVKDKGIEKRIYFPGNISEIHKNIADARLFVLSSDYEGLSNALLEALMMGLPVISTDCSGVDEVIENGDNGLIVPVGNKKLLTNAMKKVLENNAFKEKIATRAKIKAQEFSADRILEKWDEVILKN